MDILADKVKLVEVAPRDGLQFEKFNLTTEQKIEFIDQLSQTGLTHIEASSFVSEKKISRLADAEQVYAGINKLSSVLYSALVPNEQGLQRALQVKVQAVAVFTAVSESFCKKNIDCSIEESIRRITPVMETAKANNIPVRAYISCIFACPYEGWTDNAKVVELTQRLLAMGCEEVSLSDTIGIGTVKQARQLVRALTEVAPVQQLAIHFHDSRGQALANILACLELGIRTIDTSVAGLGGCPYAPGASGNVATEDVVYMLDGLGVQTGVDLTKLIVVGNAICQKLKRANQSKLARAGLPAWYK
ncbi:MAG: hydroxymethylglutaryl-CoA lyase [Thiohalomonadales bacterium]